MNIILITGGLGFIGGHFLKKIKGNTSFEKIIVFDKMTYASNYKRLKNMDLNLHKILVKRKSCGETFILKV